MVTPRSCWTTAVIVAAGSLPAAVLATVTLLTVFNGLAHRWDAFYATPAPGTTEHLMEAIEEGNLAEAHAAIVSGADPNDAVAFSDVHVTNGYVQFLRPLVLAAARSDENMVSMLISAGADARPWLGADGLCPASESAMETAITVLARHQLPLGDVGICPAGSVPPYELDVEGLAATTRQLRPKS
jgi:hypothetical protein